MSLDDFPRIPLLFGPSPIHPLPRLSEALGGGVEVWAKREDCNSGIAFGGNKVRKLEYLVAEALEQGCDTLVSIGGVQSNHTRQVTGVARHLGLGAVTVQEGWVDWPESAYEKVGNIQLTRIMGGDIRMDPAGFDIGIMPGWAHIGEPPDGLPPAWLTGPPEKIAEELRADRDVGANAFHLKFRARTMEEYLDQLAAFGEQVRPLL